MPYYVNLTLPKYLDVSRMKVEFITATWCARCKEIKPRVVQVCAAAGVELVFVDYTDLEEEEKGILTSLPTIRYKGTTYVTDTIEDWVAAVASQKLVLNDDF